MADKKKKKVTSKKPAEPKKKASPKKAVKSVKSTAKKQTRTTKASATKKRTTATQRKQTKREKPLKHDDKFEASTDGFEKIIVVGKSRQPKKPKSNKKELKRVASVGGFTAWDGRTGKTFATEQEARDYAMDFFKRTGEIIAVTHTNRTVSHTFKAENKTGK